MGKMMSSGACCLRRVRLQRRRCVRKFAVQHPSVVCIHQPDVWCWLVSRSPNRFSVLECEEEENEDHIRDQDRQSGMRVSQHCAQEFSQRSVSATVVECTASQNLFSQIRGRRSATKEDQYICERDHGDEVFVDGPRERALRRERNMKKFLLWQLRTYFW